MADQKSAPIGRWLTWIPASCGSGRACRDRGLRHHSEAFRTSGIARGAQIAFPEERLGIWRATSWRDYGEVADGSGLGSSVSGSAQRRRLDPRRHEADMAFADMGVMSVGGISNGIYPPTPQGRSSTSSTTAARASCSWRTMSGSIRTSRCARAARTCTTSSCSTWRVCLPSAIRRCCHSTSSCRSAVNTTRPIRACGPS